MRYYSHTRPYMFVGNSSWLFYASVSKYGECSTPHIRIEKLLT